MNEHSYSHLDEGAYRVAYLIAGYIRNTLTTQEHQELDDWVNASDENMRLFEDLTDERNIQANLDWMDKVRSKQSYEALQKSGAFGGRRKISVHPLWVAAASVVLLAGIFLIYHYSNKSGAGNGELVQSELSTPLQPGGRRATLTLGDGAVIDVTAAKSGLMKNDNGTDIIKTGEGQLLYKADTAVHVALAIHMLSTPLGGEYELKLPDGTMVWLNAASSIKYPPRFTGSDRMVALNGEAYFEVAKNDRQPFHVVLPDSAVVTVLGTHFDVMSYQGEAEKSVTLLEGSVTVSKKGNSTRLEPGMQAAMGGEKIVRREGVDTEGVVGWKNGYFVFHDASIETIMHQVERWYGAQVVYQAHVKQLFNATILRKEPLPKLLHLLELNGYVHFKIENRTIYVLS